MKHASMNRIYRLVWNAALSVWVAVAENARGRGKGGSTRRAVLALASLLGLVHPLSHAADAAHAAISAGTGTVSTSGAVTTINQASQRLAIDWSRLSTTANEALVFRQPSTSSIALNRVTGSDASQLLGSLSANGQVFVLNPNGVLFGATSQVNVGGLVASTLSLGNDDFMAGKFSFASSGGRAAVTNQGNITAAEGGYIALLAPEVRNEGVITARLGTALLAAGNKVTLQLDNGSLLGYSIDQGAVNALAENKKLIKADGGQVLLTATALDALTTASVNNTGFIEAQTVEKKSGRILLLGDMATGTANVGGTLDASAPNGGNGGFIETSAHVVKTEETAKITTRAPGGHNGTLLVDPDTFEIRNGGANSGSGINSFYSNTYLQGLLAANDVTIQVDSGSRAITVNGPLSWPDATTLTLRAVSPANGPYGTIAINQPITFTSGGLYLETYGGTITANVAIKGNLLTLAYGKWIQVNANLPELAVADFRLATNQNNDGATFIRATGGNGTPANPYQLVDIYGVQGMGGDAINLSFKLAANIDASSTGNWDSGAGFMPIAPATQAFTGNFDGNGYLQQ
jgi:filamentous hemagglutinin family protein